ncbi:sensor histidine kinase [Roseateles sp.]|uniref:sensor histidine kinase n=1 Tax=Roseateles sp. TaxID=1971397 RepID=UPI003BA5B6C1
MAASAHRAKDMQRRYFWNVGVSALLLLLATSFYGWTVARQLQSRLLNHEQVKGEQIRLAMTQRMDVARDHVNMMRRSIEIRLRLESLNPDTSLLSSLRRASSQAPLDAPWDQLPAVIKAEVGSLYVGDPSGRQANGPNSELQAPLLRELEAVVSILPGVAALHQRQPVFQWSYYYDAQQRLSLLYPGLSRADLFKATETEDMVSALKLVFAAGGTHPLEMVGPTHNPKRHQVWTQPYQDSGGKGMMVSLLEPVYEHQRMVGAVGTDLTLAMLDATLQSIPLQLGRAMVIDPTGQILADSAGPVKPDAKPSNLAEILPDLPVKALFGAAPKKLNHDSSGHWISFPLEGTPWRLLVHVQDAALEQESQSALLPYLLLTLGFVFALAGMAWLQHRRFTQPALQLAGFVETVDLDDDARPPKTAAAWSHWFERVAQRALERRQHLEQIRQHAVQLESQVERRTQALQVANQSLESAMQALRNAQNQLIQNEKLLSLGKLTAGLAHELNTPLGNALTAASTVEAAVQELKSQIEGNHARRDHSLRLLEQSWQGAQLAVASIERANLLITGFKQLGEAQGSDPPQHLELQSFLHAQLEQWQQMPNRGNHRIELSSTLELTLLTHPGALAQALQQLVENALQHGLAGRHEPGLVQIHAERRERDGQAMVRLTVRDNGCGMNAHQLPQLFDPFYSSHFGHGNSGLGAYLCYILVTGRLGGSISARSPEGSGLICEIDLPLNAPAA